MNSPCLQRAYRDDSLYAYTHIYIHIRKEEMCSDASVTDYTSWGSVRGTVHSRQGWSGESGRSYCSVATVFREKPAFTAWLLHWASEICGSSHTRQTYLLNLDSLQKSQSLRFKITRYRSDSRRTEVKSWSIKLQPTYKFMFSSKTILVFMDKNSAYQSRVKKSLPRIPLNSYDTISRATRYSKILPC